MKPPMKPPAPPRVPRVPVFPRPVGYFASMRAFRSFLALLGVLLLATLVFSSPATAGRPPRGGPTGAAVGGGGFRPPVDTGPRGDAPVYFLLFSHHYAGKGGYYASAEDVRGVADACIDAGIAKSCLLFLDGIMVERLQQEDPKLIPWLKGQGFAFGYHGEDVHGPYPILDAAGEGPPGGSVVTRGMTFAQAIAAIQQRYTHAITGVQFDDRGYIVRAAAGKLDTRRAGGIASVREVVGNVQAATGTPFTQPAALPALKATAPEIQVWQGAGPFAFHLLRLSRDTALIEAVQDYLGKDTTAFWYMGALGLRQGVANDIPAWSSEVGPRRTLAALDALPRRVPTVVSLNMDIGEEPLRETISTLQGWIAQHPGSAILGPAQIAGKVAPAAISLDPAAVAQQVVATWNGAPPDVLSVGGAYVSLTDAFEVMARSLGEASTKPVTTTGVLGAIGQRSELVEGSGTVTVAEVGAASRYVTGFVASSPWRSLPLNVPVGKTTVGFHQFYRLLADAVLARTSPAKALTVPTADYRPPTIRETLRAYPHEDAPDVDFWTACQYWTVRPVAWR